jgi:hypothetical protein
MSSLLVRPATRAEIEAYHDDLSCHVEDAGVALYNGEIIAMGGFARKHDRIWVTLDLEDSARRFGLRLVRAMQRGLRARGETVFIQCDGDHAERLLRILGFVPTDEAITDMRDGKTFLRIWKWQNWQL